MFVVAFVGGVVRTCFDIEVLTRILSGYTGRCGTTSTCSCIHYTPSSSVATTGITAPIVAGRVSTRIVAVAATSVAALVLSI